VLNDLPEKWLQYPCSSSTTKVFTNLAKQNNFFALKVPSSIVGLEYNIILNPLYKAFGKVEIKDFIKLPLDDRLKVSRQG